MAKDYGRNRSMRRGSGGSKQFLMVLLAFLIGYLAASIFDFVSLSHWVNTKFLTVPVQKSAPVTAKNSDLPKPKFEFYTLLANGRTQPVSQKPPDVPVVVNNTKPTVVLPPPLQTENKPLKTTVATATPIANKESYVIQVGSFKTPPEAERMKAALLLKGFSVNIVPITQAQTIWYRVIIGPYLSYADAQKIQVAFAQSEHVKGMIRKND